MVRDRALPAARVQGGAPRATGEVGNVYRYLVWLSDKFDFNLVAMDNGTLLAYSRKYPVDTVRESRRKYAEI
jgi:endonuclease I